MLGAMALASGVSIVAATPSTEVSLMSIQFRKALTYDGLTDWHWTASGSASSIEGDAITRMNVAWLDTGATSSEDAESRSRVTMEIIQNDETVYTWHPVPAYFVYSQDLGGWFTVVNGQDTHISTDTPTHIQTILEVYEGGYWVSAEVWHNYIGGGEPFDPLAGDQILTASLDFSFGSVAVQHGDHVQMAENGTLTGLRVTGTIGNYTVPAPMQDQRVTHLVVRLLDPNGNEVYSDILERSDTMELPGTNDYVWVEYENMDIAPSLFRFNEGYSLQINQYCRDAYTDPYTYHLMDRWVIYLDNNYVPITTEPDDPIGASIYGALGMIGVIGFVGSPMIMAALMRRGEDSYRIIPLLIMLMVVSGIFAYVFLLGGT